MVLADSAEHIAQLAAAPMGHQEGQPPLTFPGWGALL